MVKYKKARKVWEQEDWGFIYSDFSEFNSQFWSRRNLINLINRSCATILGIGTYLLNKFSRRYCVVIEIWREKKIKNKKVNFLSDGDTGSGRGGSYIKLHSKQNFAGWKRKTEDLDSQQGYKWFLIGQMYVASEEEL